MVFNAPMSSTEPSQRVFDPAARTSSERDLSLDVLKGFLILLVLIGHAPLNIAVPHVAGSFIGSLLARLLNLLPPIYYFHMALFFSVTAVHTGALPLGKLLRRLLAIILPLVFWICWPVLSYFLESYIFNAQRPPFLAFVTGPVWNWLKGQLGRIPYGDWSHVGLLWFLTALASFVVLMTASGHLWRYTGRSRFGRPALLGLLCFGWCTLIVFAPALAQAHVTGSIPWGMDIAAYLLPLGLLHRWLYQHREQATSVSAWVLVAALVIGELLLTNFEPIKTHSPYAYRVDFAQFSVPVTLLGILGFFLLTSSLFLLVLRAPVVRAFAWLGFFSLPIYVMHMTYVGRDPVATWGLAACIPATLEPGSRETIHYLGRLALAIGAPIAISLAVGTLWPGARRLGFVTPFVVVSWRHKLSPLLKTKVTYVCRRALTATGEWLCSMRRFGVPSANYDYLRGPDQQHGPNNLFSVSMNAPRNIFPDQRIAQFGKLTIGLIIALLIASATWANSDLIAGRPFLHMDEKLGFDGVKRILTAPSWSQFIWAITDGADHRYGRIFYNIAAVFAWLPFKIWGDQGLIIAVRSVQVASFVTATAILCSAVLRTWAGRSVAVLLILVLPYTDYYCTLPKPEPVQLLFYSLFCWFGVRRGFGFGWHWIFLGLAFGAKISAAPLIAIAGLVGLMRTVASNVSAKGMAVELAKSGITALAGWIIAIPMLLVPNKEHISAYLQWTFKATGHGSDDARVNIFSWLSSIFGGEAVRGYFPGWIAISFAIAAVIIIAVSIPNLPRLKISIANNQKWAPWIMLLFSTALTLPILLTVKRIWGFYLLPGQFLGVVALVGLTEGLVIYEQSSKARERFHRWITGAGAVVALVLVVFSLSSAMKSYHALAHRTTQAEFKSELATYDSNIIELERLYSAKSANGEDSPLQVAYDPFLFLPDSNRSYTIREFWGPFDQWNIGHQVIVLSRKSQLKYLLGEVPLPPPESASYAAWKEAQQLFVEKVDFEKNDTTKPYRFVGWTSSDSALIINRELAQCRHATSETPSQIAISTSN
jgi:fucose 4-O-acetylase-like acetyltransferase